MTVATETLLFEASDGLPLFCYRWLGDRPPRAVIHIAHGMGEHAGRYDWAARELAEAGYVVYASDHRGHGKTATTLGHFGPDGWNRIIADLQEMILARRETFPGIPAILLGHSMGAMLAEQYIELHGDSIDAVVLSGSPGFTALIPSVALRLIVRFEGWRLGPDADSPLLQSLVFGAANKAFESEVDSPNGFEWLSRDPGQVERYLDDPACGFVPCTGSLFDLFRGAAWTQRKASIRRIPRDLPVLLVSGKEDPVHNGMGNLTRLLKRYRGRGLAVDTRFYNGGRHEMLNETNRSEVMDDLLGWIDLQVA